MRPPQSILGRLPGTHTYADVSRHPEAKQHAGIAVFRFVSSLHFANKDYFRDSLMAALAEAARLQEASNVAEEPPGGGVAEGSGSEVEQIKVLVLGPSSGQLQLPCNYRVTAVSLPCGVGVLVLDLSS